VSAFTWPAAGPSSLCFKPSLDSATPAKPPVWFRTYSLLAVAGGALLQTNLPDRWLRSLGLARSQPGSPPTSLLASNRSSAHNLMLMNNAG
jgi:hypothetical protein